MMRQKTVGLVVAVGLICAVGVVRADSPITGSVGFNSGWIVQNNGQLWAGNPNTNNHMMRVVMKFPLGNYSSSTNTATLSLTVQDNALGSGQTANYFVLEHYTYQNNYALEASDASTTLVERVGGVQAVTSSSQNFIWNVKACLDHDQGESWTYSGFRLALTDAAGNYLTETGGQAVVINFIDPPTLAIFPLATGPVKGSVGLSGYIVQNNGQLWAGNPGFINHMMRGVVKFPLSEYTDPIGRATLSATVIDNVPQPGQTANYFVLEHYTYQNNYALNASDASTILVERVGGVQAVPSSSESFTWDVQSFVEHDRAAGWTHSAFRFVLTDADGNYVTYTNGETNVIIFSDVASLTVSAPLPVIPVGTAMVDGNLNEWAGADWISCNQLIYSSETPGVLPPDVTSAQWAARWNPATNRIYVAVQVVDTQHIFNSEHLNWDSLDCIEVYVDVANKNASGYQNASGSNPAFTNAQQYMVSPDGQGGRWAGLGGGYVEVLQSGILAACQARVVGDTLTYELAIRPFNSLNIDNLPASTEVAFQAGAIIGLDVTVDSKYAGGFGMIANNDLQAKFTYAFNFQDYELGAGTVAVPGDANGDSKVDVSDLGILAANYGTTSGATWATGDFNNDGKVDVSDLGILAANYGTGTGAALDFNADAKTLGLTVGEESSAKAETPETSILGCGSAGLPLIAGVLLMGVFLTKLDE